MKTMKAICLTKSGKLELDDVPLPQKAEPEHLIIKMNACGINAGDKAFIAGAFAHGSIPVSQHNICGVSGAGKVVEIGKGVPERYKGKNVAIYKSLKFSEHIFGTWSEYSHMHYHHCVILPDDANLEEYSGSLVNSITPYAFMKQVVSEGHKGIVCTAGTSATGIAMLGICFAYDIPLLSIVRSGEAKQQLAELGATQILNQSDPEFEKQFEELSVRLNTTAVFDGVGGGLISKIAKLLPRNSTIYAYGFLDGNQSLRIHTRFILMKNLTIKGFGNFTSETVLNPEKLETALNDLGKIINRAHFKTKVGKTFKLEKIDEAMKFSAADGGKAVILPL